jgi:hypothetical protein
MQRLSGNPMDEYMEYKMYLNIINISSKGRSTVMEVDVKLFCNPQAWVLVIVIFPILASQNGYSKVRFFCSSWSWKTETCPEYGSPHPQGVEGFTGFMESLMRLSKMTEICIFGHRGVAHPCRRSQVRSWDP